MASYGSTILLLVGIQLGSFNPRPLDELTINLNLGDTPQVNTPMGHGEFDEDQELKAGHTDTVPVVIGGVNGDNQILSDAMYNRLGPWATMGTFTPSRQGLAAQNLAGQLYVVGGRKDLDPNNPAENEVQKLTVQNDRYVWTQDSYLNTGRALFTLTTVQNKLGQKTLMVTGGVTGLPNSALRSTEIYFPSAKVWKNGPEMLRQRFGHAAAFLHGNLYVFGGHGLRANESTEFLNFNTGTWSFGPRLRNLRTYHAAAVLGDYIYTCGGNLGNDIVASCERFDGNVWRYNGDMKQSRMMFGMVTIGAKIWAIGGIASQAMLDSVETYDKDLNIWTSEENLKLQAPRMLFGVATYSIDI